MLDKVGVVISANRARLARLSTRLLKWILILSLSSDERVQALVKVEIRLTVANAKVDDRLYKHIGRERKYKYSR